MSTQKTKGMGNLSRAAGEMKKKLELSFSPQSNSMPKGQTPEVGKSMAKEERISGKSVFKPVSKVVEVDNEQSISPLADRAYAAAQAGSRYKKVVPRATAELEKSKATFCLDTVAVEQFNQVYINRLRTYQKADRSSLACEAISLLFEKEMLK
jgi:hypothetical protein